MSAIRDCIYGQAVGDALGVPYEFKARGSFNCKGMTGFGTHNQPAGTWSDDTSMALAICDSYKQCNSVDIPNIRSKFLAWYKYNAYSCDEVYDIGNTTAISLETGVGAKDEFSNGNGSLMRTVPLAFTNATEQEVKQVSAITHANPVSMQACVKLVEAAKLLIAGKSPKTVAGLVGVDCAKPKSEIHSSGYVLHTFEAALWCLANTKSYKECVLTAVNLGDDTDTTAAVAGALAGIVYGLAGIPKEWLKQLRGKEVLNKCLF